MTIYNAVGYIQSFAGTTLVDNSTKHATNRVQNAARVINRSYTLPNGTVVDYDGTSNADLTPGSVSQEILVTSSGASFYTTMLGLLGTRGDLVLLKDVDGLTRTASARLIEVDDTTTGIVSRAGHMKIRLTWQVLGNWA